MAFTNRVKYRVPLRKKGILTVPQAIRSSLPEEVIFEWEAIGDGSFRVTPLGLHKVDVAWFYDEAWIDKEKEATRQADRGEGVEYSDASEAIEAMKQRLLGDE